MKQDGGNKKTNKNQFICKHSKFDDTAEINGTINFSHYVVLRLLLSCCADSLYAITTQHSY